MQKNPYILFQDAATACIAIALRVRSVPLPLQSGFKLLLFIWFHTALQPGDPTLRLLYPAIAMFIGAGWLLRDRPRLPRVMIVFSWSLLAGGVFSARLGFS